MKRVFKSKINNKKKIVHKYRWITFFLIFLLTFFFLIKFNSNIKNQLISIPYSEINRVMYRAITDKITHDIINEESVSDILIINKNNAGEILYVDFNLDKAYTVLDNISKVLTDYISSLENGNVSIAYQNTDLSHNSPGITLNIPIGSMLNSNYFYNIGPKIPVKINFIGSVYTNLMTKVTNYGLNNALVEVFVYIEFHNQILSPFKIEDIELKYDAVIASMMIEGEVPSFYNGVIEKESGVYETSLD